MNNILVTICARGGSKGIPGKNIKSLMGKPLIGYSIELAKRIHEKTAADLSLSSDDETIINVASGLGLSTNYRRPAPLASDSAGKIDAIAHLLLWEEKFNTKEYDYVIDLDVTSPLRTLADVMNCFDVLQSNPAALNIFSVSPARRNPYFNMVEEGEYGFCRIVKTSNVAQFSRQLAPKVFDINGSFYIYRRNFFTSGMRSAITDRSLMFPVPHTCFDLDEVEDFEFMEFLMMNNKLGFELT